MGNLLTQQVANGNAFFIGLVAVVLAAFCRIATQKKRWQVWTRIAAVIGTAFIFASSTPASLWIYALWLVLFAATFGLRRQLFFWHNQIFGIRNPPRPSARRPCKPWSHNGHVRIATASFPQFIWKSPADAGCETQGYPIAQDLYGSDTRHLWGNIRW